MLKFHEFQILVMKHHKIIFLRKEKMATTAKRKPKKKTSPGSVSKAVADDSATNKLQDLVLGQIKKAKLSGVQLHRETGISLAMSRRLTRGDKTDMKVSTLARLIKSPKIGLKIAAV